MKSPLWYLLPAFLGITGGLIAYLILKNNDSKKAKNALLIGIIVSIPFFVLIGMSTMLGAEMFTMEGNQIVIGGPFYSVYGGSMIPVIVEGDLLSINANESFEEVEIGDIIIFNNPTDPNRVNFARVVSITNEDPKTIRTQGDANPGSIPGTDFPITEEEYIGKVEYIISYLGYVIQSPNPIILIVMYVGIILGIVLFKRQKLQEILDSELPSSTAASTKESQEENITDIDKQIAINEEKIRKIEEESKKLDEDDWTLQKFSKLGKFDH